MFLPLKRLVGYVIYEILKRGKCDRIVLNSFKNQFFNFNSRHLFLYLRSRDIECYFIIDNEKRRNLLKAQYGNYFISSSKWKDITFILKSKTWVTSTGLPIRLPFLGRNHLLVNLWHGVPLKFVGLDERHVSILRQLVILIIYRNQYSLIASTCRESGEMLARALANSTKVVRVLGQPQNDCIGAQSPPYLKSDPSNFAFQSESHSKILYAPTYRDAGKVRFFPFFDFDLEKMRFFLEEIDASIYFRPHHLDRASVSDFSLFDKNRFVDFSDAEDISEHLSDFDLLITDYSSLIFDFLLTQNPMLFLPFDLDLYRYSRGMYYEYDEVTPGPKPTSQVKFCNEVSRLLEDENYYSDERKNCRARFHQFNGSSCAEVTRVILEQMKD